MDKSERHSAIVEDLDREPALRVNGLARRFDVSAETIRRDLSELTQRGLINRTYGGAVRIISSEPAINEREHIQVAERGLIARMAVNQVVRDDVLMIGGGITTRYFAKSLALRKDPITVITPSFSVAMALGTCDNVTVHVLPGEFNGSEGLVQGADTIESLSHFRATKAFLGASGLSEEGPSDAAVPAGRIYQTMSTRASYTYILADSSKFDQTALSRYAIWSRSISLVTDSEPTGALKEALTEAGCPILLARDAEDLSEAG